MEARIPISAKPRVVLLCRLVRAAFSESLKDGETHRRLPRPECRRGGESGKADRQRILFLLRSDFFSIAPVQTKIIVLDAAIRVTDESLVKYDKLLIKRNGY